MVLPFSSKIKSKTFVIASWFVWGCCCVVCQAFFLNVPQSTTVPTHQQASFPSARYIVCFAASTPSNDDDDSAFSIDVLQERIVALKLQEAQQEETSQNILNRRVQEIRSSEVMDETISGASTASGCLTLEPKIVNLPVLAMDALLPTQVLEGRTEDVTFIRFLRQLGLGGRFVMNSLDPSTRKMRRHGVIVKILALDATTVSTIQPSLSSKINDDDPLTSIPTAVDFVLKGEIPCRIVLGSKDADTKCRMGRWRRGYDPNGEESCLGWGDERFRDAEVLLRNDTLSLLNSVSDTTEKLAGNDWNDISVLVHIPSFQEGGADEFQEKVEELSLLVDKWYDLATNTDTYKNLNVTASTRIRPDEPGLWVEPSKLLARVKKQVGPKPLSTDANKFCLWAAALINPLPPLGVSLEIRGRILEAPTTERRLQILELGLRRSIENLEGIRPLM